MCGSIPPAANIPSWDLISDHRGEFAQARAARSWRLPRFTGEAELLLPAQDDPHHTQKKRVKAEAKVHLDGEERQDLSLHLIN